MGPGSKKTGGFAVIALFLALTSTVSAQSSSCSFSFSDNREYATCLSLSQLNSFLHWTYNASTATADIAFRATNVTVSSTGNWVAWALNPTSSGMIGAQACPPYFAFGTTALVAFKTSSGSMSAYTSSVVTAAISTLKESALSYTVTNLTAESSGSQIIIFAKIQVPANKTSVNHVWQVGPLSGGSPAQHLLTTEHRTSFGTLDFLSSVSQAPVDSSPSPANAVPMQAGSTPPPPPPQGSGSSTLTKEKFAVTLCLLAVLLA
ncbi:hypothetical protein V2J09_006520 [Rumex salicifolius]